MPMGEQVAVRLDGEQLREIDRLIDAGAFPNRAAAVRAGLVLVLQEQRRRAIDDAYRRGYSSQPQTGDDLEWVETAGQASLAEME
jgi:Arc/MetJ-type ribon-helix-helix transcriptional regulator